MRSTRCRAACWSCGHTDDQPLRSFRYRDNYELSRERAVSVVEVLQPAIDNPARLECTGVGSSQPRYRPNPTPENRARNRRVEIVHVRDAYAVGRIADYHACLF